MRFRASPGGKCIVAAPPSVRAFPLACHWYAPSLGSPSTRASPKLGCWGVDAKSTLLPRTTQWDVGVQVLHLTSSLRPRRVIEACIIIIEDIAFEVYHVWFALGSLRCFLGLKAQGAGTSATPRYPGNIGHPQCICRGGTSPPEQ